MPETSDRSKLMHLTLAPRADLRKVASVACGTGNGEHA
jgi:hypothetical protein